MRDTFKPPMKFYKIIKKKNMNFVKNILFRELRF